MNEKMNEKQISGNFSEDWLPIKQILNGMIQLDTGEFVTGVKIAPRNIFIIAERPVDIDVYVSQLQLMYNNATNNAQRRLIMQDINKANLFTSRDSSVVDTEYYILFKEKRMEIVQKKLHNMISGLASAGLQSAQTSNNDLRMILDNFLNGGETTNFGAVM